jgi:ribonuclease PH
MRPDHRQPNELRPLKIKRRYMRSAPGSVLIQAGRTTVLCSAAIEPEVPGWMKGQGRGWLTAEYSMLPGSTSPRKKRDRGVNLDGRTTEIQRLIGRSLRAIIDLAAIGERTVTIDCDVLEADGGTRTLSITGAFLALVDALQAVAKDLPRPASGCPAQPLRDSLAAVSVGIVAGKPLLDLCYEEDVAAEVDMNVVMTGSGRFIELQGTGEEATFSEKDLSAMLDLARGGIRELTALQAKTLGRLWAWS